MSRLRGLLPATFKGIGFYVRSEVLTEGGRRIVLHDYPNSSERFVEDLGELPPKFTITAFVTGPDFLNRADQLERALKEEGAGRLSMPTLGAVTVFALPYRKDATQADVGEVRFELSFAAGRPISGPRRAPNTVETVYSLGDKARKASGDALEKKWTEPKETSNVITAIYDLEQCAKSTDLLLTSLKNVADVNAINKFVGFNAPSIVRSGVYIKRVFVDKLWQTLSVGLSGGAGLASLIGLTSFGALLSLSLSDIQSASVSSTSNSTSTDVPLWPQTTAARTIRNNNRLSLINTHRINALIVAYEQAADKTYQTDQELDEIRSNLEDQHQRLMRVDTENRDLPQSDSAVRDAIEVLRLASLSVLDQKDQSAYSLTTLTLNVAKSAFVLSYDLYAESLTNSGQIVDRAIVIRGLNPEMPADRLAGDVMVLQS